MPPKKKTPLNKIKSQVARSGLSFMPLTMREPAMVRTEMVVPRETVKNLSEAIKKMKLVEKQLKNKKNSRQVVVLNKNMTTR